MYHKVLLAGYLGRDPELRYTQEGTPVTNFSVATSRKWTGKDGDRREETLWWRVSAWGKLAEICNEYLAKGRPALIEGRLVPDSRTGGPRIWHGQDGEPRASYEVRAQTVRFLGGGNSGSGDSGSMNATAPASTTPGQPPAAADDIPF